LRLRSYGDLAELTPAALLGMLTDGLAAKLQLKAASGDTAELTNGRIVVFPVGAEPGADDSWELWLGARRYAPTSVRVARRTHHILPAKPGSNPVRVTVDHERHLFRMVTGLMRPLGQMGPRVEVKADSASEIEATLATLNPNGLLKRLPYGSLELLFQDLLRDTVVPGTCQESPEIEAKFDICGRNPATVGPAVIDWLSAREGTRLLLPFPHQIVRMRRYHVCAGADDAAEHSVVETTAGLLSAKVKRNAMLRDGVLLRRTVASRTTDIDGACEPIELFLARRGWRRLSTFTKVQTKIPFALPNGNAYLVSIDNCVDACGKRLNQLELEYIGYLGAPAAPQDICAEVALLASQLAAQPLGQSLQPTAQSKHAFFLPPDYRLSGSAAGCRSSSNTA
jgi:hypothetical protein